MTDSTDRVLASIDEAIDGYVSEDWTVGDDAMRWRPEEPEQREQGDPWIASEVWGQAIQSAASASVVDWFGEYFDEHMALSGFQRAFLNQMYASTTPDFESDYARAYRERYAGWSDTWRQTFEGSWCTATWIDELRVDGYRPAKAEASSGVEPHWDDSLVASMDRTRQGEPEPAVFGPSPVVIARTTEAIEEALRSHAKPEPEPLTVNWKVDAGRVSGKRRNRR